MSTMPVACAGLNLPPTRVGKLRLLQFALKRMAGAHQQWCARGPYATFDEMMQTADAREYDVSRRAVLELAVALFPIPRSQRG